MNILEVTDEQLRLIQQALDFYSRVGIGQFERIKDHPTFQRHLENVCKPDWEPRVGDRTPQGEILEIKDGKALINGSVDKKTGHWCDKKEWKKLEDVKLSTDYSRYHEIRDMVDSAMVQPRNMLIQDFTLGRNASWGIYSPSVDDSCRVAFDIVQVIRHEYWKKDPNRSSITVDSHIHFSHRADGSSEKIKCKLDVDNQNKLIELLENQIMDLTIMSKIELGDDVIQEIKRLKGLLKVSVNCYKCVMESMRSIENSHVDQKETESNE